MGRPQKDAGVVDVESDWRVDPVCFSCDVSTGVDSLWCTALLSLKIMIAARGTQDAVEHAVCSVEAAITAAKLATGKVKRMEKGKGKRSVQRKATAPAAGHVTAATLVPAEDPNFKGVVSAIFASAGGAGRAARRVLTKVLISSTILDPLTAAQLHAAELRHLFATTASRADSVVGGTLADDAAVYDGGDHTTPSRSSDGQLQSVLRCVTTVSNVLDAPPNIVTAALSEQGVLNAWLAILNTAMVLTSGAGSNGKELQLVCRAATSTFQKVGSVFDAILSPVAGSDAAADAAAHGTIGALHSIGNVLALIVRDSGNDSDSILLAGMAVGYLLKLPKWLSILDQAAAVHAVFFSSCSSSNADDGVNPSIGVCNLSAVQPKLDVLSTIPWLVPLANQTGAFPEIAELAAIRATLSILDKQVLLSAWDRASDEQGKTILFDLCFPRLRALSHSRSPVALWLAHSSLAMWISTANAAAKKQPERFFAACNFLSVYKRAKQLQQTNTTVGINDPSSLSSSSSPCCNNVVVGMTLFEEITRLIWESWEHPVAEIRGLTKSMFGDLLALLEFQSKWASKVENAKFEELSGGVTYADIPATGFCELLAIRLTRSQWHVKGRYGLLCIVATRLGLEKLLGLAPSLISECIKCLQVNSLAPQGIRLISELLKSGRKEWEVELFGKYKGPLTTGAKSKKGANRAELEAREVAVAAKWSAVWRDLMLNALAGDNQHARSQVAMYWLPETMKLFPMALNSIIAEYNMLLGYDVGGNAVVGFVDASTAQVRSRRLHALMVIIKSARGAGLISSNSLHGSLLPTDDYNSDQYDDNDDDDSDSGGGGGGGGGGDDDDSCRDGENGGGGGGVRDGSGVVSSSPTTTSLTTVAVPFELVHEALCHSDFQVQVDALAFVCCDLRTTAEITQAELILLREFITRNLNISDPGARHQFLSLMKVALCRLRDSWVAHSTASDAVTRKLQRHDAEHGSVECDVCLEWVCEMDTHEDGITRTGDMMVEFVEWLESITIVSLYPGASYQRSLTAVRMFSVLYNLFNRSTNTSGIVWPEWPDGFPNLSSARNATVLVGVVFNSHADVRSAASTLLANDFSAPIRHQQVEGIETDGDGSQTAAFVANAARVLIASGRVHECEVGAELFKVLYSNFVIKRNGIFSIATSTESDGSSSSKLVAALLDASPIVPGLSFVELLLDLIQTQLDVCRADLARASREAAPNGLILALKEIWATLDPRITADASIWAPLVERAVTLTLNVGTFALETLVFDVQTAAASVDEDSNESMLLESTDFGNTENALDQAVHMYSPAVASGTKGEEGGTAPGPKQRSASTKSETPSHPQPQSKSSEGHENTRNFVLAMSWRTLKEASLFLGDVFNKSSLPGESGSGEGEKEREKIAVDTIERIGSWMNRVLMSCRHRGVIETCAVGFGALCKRLSKSKSKVIQKIPAKWLESCITLMCSDVAVSITRRGAGLPYVLHAIVTNERNVKIVEHAFVTLLKIAADQKVPKGWDETMDLPAVRALNTLNILFRDGALGDASQPFMAEAAIIAINGFAASEWAIANTCMMVFGTLAQKMLGTKRVKDDRSHINLITAREFFARYPSLRSFISERLQTIVASRLDSMAAAYSEEGTTTRAVVGRRRQRPVEPELYPLLTLLARLQSNAEADPEQAAEMQLFVELLAELTGNCIFAIRTLAARALVPMVALSECGKAALMWLRTIPASASNVVVHNDLHGALLAAHGFLSAWLTSPPTAKISDATVDEVVSAVARVQWLLDRSQNRCSFTAATFGDICNLLLSSVTVASTGNKGFGTLAASLQRIVVPEQFAADHHTIGDWWYQTVFAEILWRTRIAVVHDANDAQREPKTLIPSPTQSTVSALSASQLLASLLATPNADVRRHSYTLLVQVASAMGSNNNNDGADPIQTLPADVGQIIAWACYQELAHADGGEGCKTVSVEALVAVGESRNASTLIFPVTGRSDAGHLSASTLWDCLIEAAATSEDDRLHEACVIGAGLLMQAAAADSEQASDDAVYRVEQWVVQLTAGGEYEAASSMRLAAAKSILVGANVIFGNGASRIESNAMQGIRQSVLKLLVRALQDEDEDVRLVAGVAVSNIYTAKTACSIPGRAAPSIQSTLALEQCYDLLCIELQASADDAVDNGVVESEDGIFGSVGGDGGDDKSQQIVAAWSSLLKLALGRNPIDDEDSSTRADDASVLFVKEESNTFAEPLYDTQLAVLASYKLLTKGGKAPPEQQQHAGDEQQPLEQQVCKALREDPDVRETFLVYAAQTAKTCCSALLRDLSSEQPSFPSNANLATVAAAAESLGGVSGDNGSGQCSKFLRMYRSTVGLAAATFAVGAVLYAADPDSMDTAKISSTVPLLAETADMLRDQMEAGSIPVVLRLAAFQLQTACTSWTPSPSSATKAYAALLASQVATLATPGGTDEQQEFLRMLVGAVALEGDGEPVGMFGGSASPYCAGESSESAWACPFRYSIPWTFLLNEE